MDFTKDIYLNKEKIYEDSELIILYTGSLSKNSDKIFISYGYGNYWDNKNEVELKKTDFGFLGNIDIKTGTDFQFCFRDANGNWDNNNYQNYILPIYKKEKEEDLLSFTPIKESEKEIQIQMPVDSENLKVEPETFSPITISSETIDIYSDKKLDNTTKNTIPEDTIVTQVRFDKEFAQKSFSEQIIKFTPEEKENETLSFADITKKAKENSVKAFDDNHITAGSVYVNSLVEDYQPKGSNPPKFIEDITINSLVPKKESRIANKNLSKIYLLKKRIKLSLFKFLKLIKTALNYNEDKL